MVLDLPPQREVPVFQVQGNKQILSSMKSKLLQQQQTLKTLEESFEKVSSKWTNEDMAVLVKGTSFIFFSLCLCWIKLDLYPAIW